ncbi:MAG: hypothetical protein SGJ04_02555 [Bacteroidota bacterium]|nr:hypothetical protein [Bacteroidota bacterium]
MLKLEFKPEKVTHSVPPGLLLFSDLTDTMPVFTNSPLPQSLSSAGTA